MKLIIIYGPPSSGKLTVAKELAKKTGFKLFHNHLVNDALSSVMDFGTKSYWKRNQKLKIDLIKIANEEKTPGLIFTMVYAGKGTVKFVKKIKKYLEKNNSKAYFVKLFCEHKQLHKRVIQKSRKEFWKLNNVKDLKEFMHKYDTTRTLPFGKHLIIDNTSYSAKKVSDMIIKFYKLKKQK
jgi:hypothetical protein